MELAPLTVLKKQYTIKRTLGTPGLFDIIYLGQDVDTKEQYIIREYFPSHLVRRESGKTSVEVRDEDEGASLFQSGMEYYQKESSVLAELEHEALSSSYHLFEANGTFYRARPHKPSMSLGRGLESKGTLSEKAALTIMVPVLEALHEAHESGLYHGGISPATVRLLEDGKVLLTGFRGAFIQLARRTGHLADLVQPGTSAIEQYTPRGNQGPWTDVYAAAATICEMVTGEKMPAAKDRLEGDDPLTALLQDADVFSAPGVREALLEALTVNPSKRLQSVDALTEQLKESSTRYDESEASYSIMPVEPSVTAPGEEDDDEPVEVLSTGGGDRPPRKATRRRSSRSRKSSNRMALFVGLPLLLGALGIGAWFVMSGGGSGPSASYAELRTRADSLFESEEYTQAEYYYEQALETREDDQYVLERLDQITELQAQLNEDQYARQMQQGDSLRQVANQQFQAGDLPAANRAYNRAMGAYFAALDVKPEDQAADQRIEQIESRQEAIARQQATTGSGQVNVGQIASFFQEQGDRQLQQGNLQAALRKYRQAQEYSPDNPGLQQAISDLEQEIADREEDSEYQAAFTRGRRLMRQQDYTQARLAFEEALSVRSTDEARNALARADSLLQLKRSQEDQYQQYRAQGDSAFQQGNYEIAINAYQQALRVQPDDYGETRDIAQRLEEARSALEEVQLAQAKQEQEQERRQNMVDEDGIYTVVDEEPRVEGGLTALHKDVRYPDAAARRGIEGRVYIRAVVNPDGTVREANVARGIGGGCDREALRVVEQASFIPAQVNGESVPAYTTVWIQFALEQ